METHFHLQTTSIISSYFLLTFILPIYSLRFLVADVYADVFLKSETYFDILSHKQASWVAEIVMSATASTTA